MNTVDQQPSPTPSLHLAGRLLRDPGKLDTEQLTEQAYLLGIGFAFIRPTISRPQTHLHILPPPAGRMIEGDPAILVNVRRLWNALHERAGEIVLYLMDHESCSNIAPDIQWHHYPTPLRKQRIPRTARAHVHPPANELMT